MPAPAETRIALCALSDAPAVRAIELASIACPWTLRDIENAIADDKTVFIKAERDGIVGYASARVVLDEAEVNNVAVRADCRNTGIGRALMESLIAEVKARGAKRVFLEVGRANAPAVKLYRSLGFTAAYERKNYYGGESALVMTLFL